MWGARIGEIEDDVQIPSLGNLMDDELYQLLRRTGFGERLF
jgi:hypothetical protein